MFRGKWYIPESKIQLGFRNGPEPGTMQEDEEILSLWLSFLLPSVHDLFYFPGQRALPCLIPNSQEWILISA